jgi:D-cysteine desulfhydrase
MKPIFPNSLQLTHGNTPLVPLNKIFADLSEYRVWMKRDDFTGVELSGNKVRKLDFLIAEAIDSGANHIITCGGVQSNHCRTAAYMARKKDLNCTLFLRGQPDDNLSGNLLLNLLAGVRIEYVTAEQYKNIDQIMNEYADELRGKDENCYVIPEGGSNATGAWGYVSCFSEIIDQIKKYHLHFDAIVVATGSGGTHAGLLIGKNMFSSDIEIISVNVCDNSDFFISKIKSIVRDFEDKYNVVINIERDDIHVIDGFVGDGYGQLNSEVSQLINQFAIHEGIVLDPVYSAKAFYGLKTMLEQGKLRYQNILFIHTGGIFGLFPAVADLTFGKGLTDRV